VFRGLVLACILPLLAVTACGNDVPAATETEGSSESSSAAEATSDTGDPGPTSGTADSSTGDPPPPVTQGTLQLLTYNVAGLPDGISGSMPIEYIPQISPLLNQYELALVQEDFAYHPELAADAEHPYQSEPHPDLDPPNYVFGDGLNEFSQYPFDPPDRVAWALCNGQLDMGSDCLTDKGFYRAVHTLSEGIEVDVYNLHMDAGGSPEDIAARDAQVAQLVAYILMHSLDRAVIVAGDTNMDEEDEASLQALLAAAGLTDVCRALDCGEEYRIDRVLYRSSTRIELTPMAWAIDATFVDSLGNDLSDHEALGVVIGWEWID
jgi:hypothetical protein